MERQLAISKQYLFAGVLVFLGLYLASLYNYLLFHSLAEIFSIVVAFSIFTIAWNSRRFLDNNYLFFIGVAYLFVGGLDLIHTLAYKGMEIFRGYQTNLATQLWIAARYTESLSLLIAPLLFKRKLKINLLFSGYTLALALLLTSIFYWKIFPVCFVEDIGLTLFKKISEYMISLILLGSIVLLLKNRIAFDRGVFRLLVWSILLTIASELAFTFYIEAYGFSNLLGHFFKIVSFYLIYKALIETGLTRPYNLLFRNLKVSEERFRHIFERSPIGIELYDSNGQLLEVNKARLEMFGLSDTAEVMGFKLFEDPNLSDELKNRLRNGENIRYEVPFDFEKLKELQLYHTTKSGIRYIDAMITPLGPYDKASLGGYLVQVQDTTKRKKVEEALRKAHNELEDRVKERTVELAKANEALKAEIAERKRSEEALRNLTYDLNKRIKEINCLYSISYYVGKQYALLDEKLQNIVNLITSGWQYPEITCVRILLDGKEYRTENLKETPWRQASEIIVHDEIIGSVEIYYLEEKPISNEGPFLKEERGLINAIAIELGEMVGHMRTEKVLSEQSKILEAFFTSTITPLVFLDRDFNFIRVNEAYAKACQREISAFSGHNHFDIYPSDAREIFEQVVETKVPYQAIARPFTFPDHPEWGVTYWDWTLTPLLGDSGEVEFLVLALQDVSERKRGEKELRSASLYARSLIEASLDPLVTISRDGKIMDVNTATELVTGVSREELIGSDFSDYFTEPEKAREGYQQVFEKGLVKDYPLAIRHTSGHVTEVLYNATVYRNEAGEVQGAFAAARDITVQRLAEEKARSEHALRAAIENSIVTGILVLDKKGRITHVNPALCHMTGWNEEELVGTVPSSTFWPLEDLEIRTESFRTLLRGQTPSAGFEAHLRRKNVERFDALVMVSSLKESEGKVLGWVGSIGDITERKEIERRIYATNVLLELFSKKSVRREYLDAVVDLLGSWSGCQCVGIRVLDKEGLIPYESYVGFSQEFWESENLLSIRRNQCACIRVITGNPDPQDISMTTAHGSFHCANTFEFVGQLSEEEKSRFRGVCLEHGYKSVSIIPIRYRGEVLGAIHLADESEGQVTFRVIEFIESVAPLIGEALHRFDLEEEIRDSENRLRILSSQLLTVQENERKRISREVHDSLGQSLSAIKLRVENTLQEMRGSGRKRVAQSLERVIPIVQQSIEEARRIQMDLRPSILDDLGISATISWFCREFKITCPGIGIETQVDIKEDEVPESLKIVIYRVMQEALNNIAKHSGADLIHLSLIRTDDKIALAIQDNGVGFNIDEKLSAERSRRGLGLTSMRERAELSGGSFAIESIKGEGTIIKATWHLSCTEMGR